MLGRKPYIRWGVKPQDLHIVGTLLADLRLERYAERYMEELSGGERQKVLIARAVYRYDSEEQLVQDNLNAILDSEYDRKAAESILRQFVTEQNGVYLYPHRFKAALLHWRPEPA